MKSSASLLPAWSGGILALTLLVMAGCGRDDAPATGLYDPIPEFHAARDHQHEPARVPLPPTPPGAARLQVLQSELSPATLWHTTEASVTLFAGLERIGLGAPVFLAWSSPTGIAVAHPGRGFTGDQMGENWLLVGFPGAQGWEEWDSPWAVFLQRRPHRVRLTTNGLHLTFVGAAGSFSMLPLYGYYKPPQRDREFLSRHGLREKKLLTWEWPIVVARDPLVRLRYWAGVTRRFPYRCDDAVILDPPRNRVVLRQSFDWLEVPDEWNTASITAAPLSPALGLAMVSGRRFPVRASREAFDFEMPTPHGPYHAVPGGDSYDLSFAVLSYVNETEVPVPPPGRDGPAGEALEHLRSLAREISRAPPDRWVEHPWFLRSLLPLMESPEREAALSGLGAHLTSVLGQQEPGDPARLLEAAWVYVHHTGDLAWLRASWPRVRGWFDMPEKVCWAAFGPTGDAAGVTPAIAYARLAWLAGDADQYAWACGLAARGLAQHFARWSGTEWFRENQPWHSLLPIPERSAPGGIEPGLAGWSWDSDIGAEGRSPAVAAEVRRLLRDPDLARARRELQGPLSPAALDEAGPDRAIAAALETLRAAGAYRVVRLIGAGTQFPPVRGVSRAVEGPNPVLLQEVTVDPATGWPRITWSTWRTPNGEAWSFGEIRVGATPPGPHETRALNWNTVEWLWRE